MKTFYLTALTLLSIFCFQFATAQPVVEISKRHGCHFYRNADFAERPTNGAVFIENNQRSDTFDIVHYDISVDVTDYTGKSIAGWCTVTCIPKMSGLTSITLDLEGLTVDSTWHPGGILPFRYDGRFLLIDLPQPAAMGDTLRLSAAYQGKPITSASGFGGVYFENDYTFNLSIGLRDDPHNFGRAWFPCFDNFVERSTYTFHILTDGNKRGYCSGDFVEEVPLPNGRRRRTYVQNLPLPTYLVSMAAADYAALNWQYDGLFGQLPVQILAKAADTLAARQKFANLGTAIGTFEQWYGPMPWSGVGYTMATRGAMENPNNIIYPEFSIQNATYDHQPLMAHELCHQWWGNMVNMRSQRDMWIKEGNAEYGSHLFIRALEGQAAFETAVSDNLLDVLKTAHLDDGSFLPLSPMPQSHTYGTHSYYKGAVVLRNLHTYLGDSLFSLGQQAVLEDNTFSTIDAQEYRDQLSAATGVDLTDFFDDWIFSPGFADFELDSFAVRRVGSEYEVQVFVQQKLRAAPHFHKNVPLSITFLDAGWREQVVQVVVDGEFSSPKVLLDFQPTYVLLNTHQELNLASLNDTRTLSQTGNTSFRNTSFSMEVKTVQEPTTIHVEHHWTAPDPDMPGDNPLITRLSGTHYWSVRGAMKPGFSAGVTIAYDGTKAGTYLDEDLVSTTEDSLILVYRPRAGEYWREYFDYRKLKLTPNDKKGFMRLNSLVEGDYAFANGISMPSATSSPEVSSLHIQAYPNPVVSQLTLQGIAEGLGSGASVYVRASDAVGQVFLSENVAAIDGEFTASLDLSGFPEGVYLVEVVAGGQTVPAVVKVVKF
jgi:aminopeptidase N